MYLYLQLGKVLVLGFMYLTPGLVQVQSNSQITEIPLTEAQRRKHDHLSKSLRLPLGIGRNDRATVYLPVPGIEPPYGVFLGECVTD